MAKKIALGRRNLMAATALTLMAGTLPGVVQAAGANTGKTLRIGVLPAADSILLHAAASEGLFKAEGVNVELIAFRSAMEIGAAIRAGELDGHYGDIMNVLVQNATGAPQKIVATMTTAGGGRRNFALLTSPKTAERFKTLEDVTKTGNVETAMSAGTIIDYLLTRIEETEKLPETTFKKTEIRQIPIRLQMLLAGKMDTAVLPEPLATTVEAKGGRALWDDRALGEPLAVLAIKNDALDAQTVRAVRKAVLEAGRRIEAEPERFRELMVAKRLVPPQAAASFVMPKYSVLAAKDGLLPMPTAADVARVGEWCVKRGMIRTVPAATEVVATVD